MYLYIDPKIKKRNATGWLGMKLRRRMIALTALFASMNLQAGEPTVETLETAVCKDQSLSYVLNRSRTSEPSFVLILFPGGDGIVNPHLDKKGRLAYRKKTNFLLRTRSLIVDKAFATAVTDSSSDPVRFRCLTSHLKTIFPRADLYLIGTSRGTFDTMRLAPEIQDDIKGVIHTSSLSSIVNFDTRKLKNRQLIVHHREDACSATSFAAAQSSAKRYGTDFIAVDGGMQDGNPCQPFSHHGYAGIEDIVIEHIKAWIRREYHRNTNRKEELCTLLFY